MITFKGHFVKNIWGIASSKIAAIGAHDQQDGQAKEPDDSDKYNNKSGDEVPIKIYISSSLILSLIIYMLLLQYGISPNPGP